MYSITPAAPPGLLPSRPFPRHDSSAKMARSGRVGVSSVCCLSSVIAQTFRSSTHTASRDRLDAVDLVEMNGQLVPRCRIARFDRLAPIACAKGERNDHIVLSPTAAYQDARALGECALQSLVVLVRQLRHAASTPLHQFSASRDSTRVARSISSTGTYSSAACAREMSPGPKQIAGIPAALSSAASVHALIPAPLPLSPAPCNASSSARTIGAPTGTSLGSCENVALMCAFTVLPRRASIGRKLSHSAASSRTTSSTLSPGIVRRSIFSAHRSGYVDIP